MAKLYTKKKAEEQELLPSKSTINFILSYSKALKWSKWVGLPLKIFLIKKDLNYVEVFLVISIVFFLPIVLVIMSFF